MASDGDSGHFNPEEKVPLLAKERAPRRVSFLETGPQRALLAKDEEERAPKRIFHSIKEGISSWRAHETHMKDPQNKVLYYDQETLLSWRAAMSLGSSALNQPVVGWMVAGCLLTAIASAVLLVALVPDAHKMNTKRFARFLVLIKVFICFMLGIYVQQSFKRWSATLMEFTKYLTSIKQMVFLFNSIKVNHEVLEEVERRSIAASYLLNTEIITMQNMNRDSSGMRQTLDDMRDEKLLEPDEHAKLLEVLVWKQSTNSFGTLAVSCTVWAWIGEIISQTKLEGGGAIAPPMHVRVLAMCQSCMGRMEELKANVVTQMPHGYAQLLTVLIYLNNFLLALACGLSMGSSASEAHMRNEQLMASGAEDRSGYKGRVGEFYEALQTMGVQLVILICEPVLYITFLNIGHILCYPFGRNPYNLPSEGFIRRLHLELLMLVESRRWSKERRSRMELQAAQDVETGQAV